MLEESHSTIFFFCENQVCGCAFAFMNSNLINYVLWTIIWLCNQIGFGKIILVYLEMGLCSELWSLMREILKLTTYTIQAPLHSVLCLFIGLFKVYTILANQSCPFAFKLPYTI
jgi:hypothetical protein